MSSRRKEEVDSETENEQDSLEGFGKMMGREGEKKPEARKKESDVDLEKERLHEEEPDEGRRPREEDAEESE